MTNIEEAVENGLRLVTWETPMDAPPPIGVTEEAWITPLLDAIQDACLDARYEAYNDLGNYEYQANKLEELTSVSAEESLKVVRDEIITTLANINDIEDKLAVVRCGSNR